MLVEFSIENFGCFKEKQVFSMVPSDDKGFSIKTGISAVDDILPVAGLYGANASGKTTLLGALDFFRLFVQRSFSGYPNKEIKDYKPFLLDAGTAASLTRLELVFIYEENLYVYGFSYDAERVHEEWLEMTPKEGRVNKLFTRAYDSRKEEYDWYVNGKIKGEKVSWQNNTRDNALFLSTAVGNNAEGYFKDAFEWIVWGSLVVLDDGGNIHVAGTANALEENDAYKERVLKLLHDVDIDIAEIKIKRRNLPDSGFESIPEEHREKFKKLISVSVEFGRENKQGEMVYWEIKKESSGTQKLFSMLHCLFGTLDDGGVLIIDELHNHFHPHLVQYIIGLFQNEKTNPNKAQLIFSSHDVLSMDPEYMGRDQIWFTDKQKDGAVELVPLSAFKDVRKDSIFWRSYIAGKYNAVPNIVNTDGEL